MQIASAHWNTPASQCDVESRFLRQLLQETAVSVLEKIRHTTSLFEAQYGDDPSLQRIKRVVTQHCHRATREEGRLQHLI